MKKLFLMLFLMVLMALTFGAVTTSYAEEITEETNEEVVVEDSMEDETEKVTGWIISGVLGLVGTSAVAVAFRKHLKALVEGVKLAISNLKQKKEETDEDVAKAKETINNALASLNEVKEELLNIAKQEKEAMQVEFDKIKNALLYLARGSKEHVVNGTAETLSTIIEEDKEVL